MKKKTARSLQKTGIALAAFALLFFLLQPFFVPKFIASDAVTTVTVNDYRRLPENSIDVLFLGSSQTYCTVDAVLLSDAYGISAYDYGAAFQNMAITPYYLTEALKTQSPSLVAVEVALIFQKSADMPQTAIAWNYAPMPLSKEKLRSLEETLGSKWEAYQHAFFPLLVYHDRWRTLGEQKHPDGRYDFSYVFHPNAYWDLYPRGYVPVDAAKEQTYDFLSSATALREIPEESKKAVERIAAICRERDIKLFFFKSPATNWTRGASATVRQFMDAHDLDFIDMNTDARTMGIDPATDFSDDKHLNKNGAAKATKYLYLFFRSFI